MNFTVVQSCFFFCVKAWAATAICLCFTNALAKEYEVFYPVTGSSMQELVDQIARNSKSPSGAFGYTKLTTDLTWKSAKNQDGVCSIESVDFTYDITIYMPEWTDIHNAKHCLQTNWNSVWNKVQQHEEEHRRLFRLLNTSEINQRISAIEPQTSCQNLKARVSAEMKLILRANDILHERFHAADKPPALREC